VRSRERGESSSSARTPRTSAERLNSRRFLRRLRHGYARAHLRGLDELASGPDSNAARDDAADATELYVLNWDDETIELYVGGAGPKPANSNDDFVEYPRQRGATVSNSPNTTTNENLVADEATRAWLSAVPDDSGGEYSDEYGKSGGWRRVGADIIYNEEEIVGVGSSGTYVFRGIRATHHARAARGGGETHRATAG